MKYLLDANAFIEAAKRFYGFDIVPAYWDWLDARAADGTLGSIEEIKAEILAHADEVSSWCKLRPQLFHKPDAAVPASQAALSQWADEQVTTGRYNAAARNAFFKDPDYLLIAYAHAHGLTVVTLEQSEPARRREIKIPDACAGMSVPCITLFEMLRLENVKFVLGHP